MAVLYITEFRGLVKLEGEQASVPLAPAVAEQTVAIAGSSAQSSAVNAATKYIRLHTDAICSIAIGADPTASSTTMRMAAGQTEYFGVSPSAKVAVITNS